MIKNTTKFRLFAPARTSILAGTALLALPVFSLYAQDPSPSPSPAASDASSGTDLSQMVVTGTYLGGAEVAGALPVKTISRAEIDRSGVSSISDLLQKIPQNGGQAFSTKVNTGSTFSPGASSIALRNLKVNATLVLVNGRRMPLFPQPQEATDSFVDLNGIPLAAIDHVEILKEGASSIYGTDAIAGVVNIILKKDYSGIEINTYYGNTTREDLSTFVASAVSGFTNEKLSIMATAEYYHQNALASSDRPYAADADRRKFGLSDNRSDTTPRAEIYDLDGVFDLSVPKGSNGRNLEPDDFVPAVDAAGNTLRRYNYRKYVQLLPDQQRYNFTGNFQYNLADHISLFGDVLYGHNRTRSQIAPTPISEVVPASNPFNPFGQDVVFILRGIDFGPRLDTTETEFDREVAGLNFDNLPQNWHADISYLHGQSKSISRGGNFLSVTRLEQALADPNPETALNVFIDGPGHNNRDTINQIKQSTETIGVTRLHQGQVNARGDLFDVPAGPVQLAFGAEYNDENFRLQRDQYQNHDDIEATGGGGGFGKRNSKGVYYEIKVPLVSSDWRWPGIYAFDVSASGRWQEYSDFGDTFKPKFAVRYQPVKPLTLRASYQEGYRAPSLPELFNGTIIGFNTVTDPNFPNQPYDVQITSGGNPNLVAETSYAYDLGADFDVPYVKGLTLRCDFYRIDQRNLIDSASEQFVIDNSSLFPGAITRGPDGRITNVNTAYRNIGREVVDGVDFGFDYRLPTKIGTFWLTADASYQNSDESVEAAGQPNVEFINSFSEPRFKANGSIGYDLGGLSLSTTINYIGDYDDQTLVRHVGAWTTFDLQASYEFKKPDAGAPDGPSDGKTASDGKGVANKQVIADHVLPNSAYGWQQIVEGLRLTVGVNNVADEDPPYANTDEGYDTSLADPTGRFYYISLNKKF